MTLFMKFKCTSVCRALQNVLRHPTVCLKTTSGLGIAESSFCLLKLYAY